MPQYELYYIVAGISDDEIPGTISQVQKIVETAGGKILSHEDEGRKKFAYPINKIRSGNYILMRFEAESNQINEIENAVKNNQTIVRHLLLNMDEALVRMVKDQKARSQMRKPISTETKPVAAKASEGKKKINIDLDAEIEKALEPEELK